jgi:hypothetical protein
MNREEFRKAFNEAEANPYSVQFRERTPQQYQRARETFDRAELRKALKLEQEKLALKGRLYEPESLQLQSAKKVLRDLKLDGHECYHTRGRVAEGKCHKRSALRKMRELDLPPPLILLVLSLAGVDVVRECEEGNLPELMAWVLKKDVPEEEEEE